MTSEQPDPLEDLDISENAESIAESHEFRDADGNEVCQAETVLGSRVETLVVRQRGTERAIKVRELRSLTFFRSEKPNERIDALPIINPFGAKVWVVQEYDESTFMAGKTRGDKGEFVIVPELGDSLSFAAMLHEMGHIKQFRSTAFDKLFALSSSKLPARIEESDVVAAQGAYKEYVGELSEAVPEVKELAQSAGFERANARAEEYRQLRAEAAALRDELERADASSREALEARLKGIVSKYTILEKALREELESDQAKAVFNLASALIEEDATRNALAVMARIKQDYGIDFGTSLYADLGKSGNLGDKLRAKRGLDKDLSEGDCVGFTATLADVRTELVETNAKEWLQAALDTYGTSAIMETLREVLKAKPEINKKPRRESSDTDDIHA